MMARVRCSCGAGRVTAAAPLAPRCCMLCCCCCWCGSRSVPERRRCIHGPGRGWGRTALACCMGAGCCCCCCCCAGAATCRDPCWSCSSSCGERRGGSAPKLLRAPLLLSPWSWSAVGGSWNKRTARLAMGVSAGSGALGAAAGGSIVGAPPLEGVAASTTLFCPAGAAAAAAAGPGSTAPYRGRPAAAPAAPAALLPLPASWTCLLLLVPPAVGPLPPSLRCMRSPQRPLADTCWGAGRSCGC